eukprot:m.217123 g.217123  ORF g.217123 m.217123 type:complete len:54 (+) comp15597_c1_seq1:25-186(+)
MFCCVDYCVVSVVSLVFLCLCMLCCVVTLLVTVCDSPLCAVLLHVCMSLSLFI